ELRPRRRVRHAIPLATLPTGTVVRAATRGSLLSTLTRSRACPRLPGSHSCEICDTRAQRQPVGDREADGHAVVVHADELVIEQYLRHVIRARLTRRERELA